jgi:hypothetical protein
MKTVPPATHDALLYPFPINVTNNTTTSAPISIELGIMLDFVDGNLNCRSIDGKNEQSKETGNIEYTRRRKHNTICIEHYYTQTKTNNVNKPFMSSPTEHSSLIPA